MNATMKPRAWLCELAEEDGTTRTQFVEEDPDGLRWNDAGEPSPYRTTPLLTMEQAGQMVAAERERCASVVRYWLAGYTPEAGTHEARCLAHIIGGGPAPQWPNVEVTGPRRRDHA